MLKGRVICESSLHCDLQVIKMWCSYPSKTVHESPHHNRAGERTNVPQFIIEREIEGVGSLSAQTLREMADKVRKVENDMAADVEWMYSFVSDNKTYCVYLAPDEAILRQHSERAGLPVSRVSRVTSVIDANAGKSSK